VPRLPEPAPTRDPAPALAFALAFAAGCASPPQPLPADVVTFTATYRKVPWLAADAAPPGVDAEACALETRAFAVRDAIQGDSLTNAAALVLASSGAPLRGAPSSLPGVTVQTGADAAAALASLERADPTAVRAAGSFDAAIVGETATVVAPASPDLPAVLAAMRGADVRLALAIGSGGRDRDEQVIALRAPLALDGDPLLVFVPAYAPPRRGFVLCVRARRGPAAEAVAAARVAAEQAAPHDGEAATAPNEFVRLAEEARRAIGAFHRRPALLALAQRADAVRAVDVVLTADEATLIAIGNALPERDPAFAGSPGAAAWRFERAVWAGLLPAMQRDELPASLRACVLRQLGAVAFEPGTLAVLVDGSADAEAFARGLREENLLSLADRDLALRVRAHDWLGQHGGAVPGFEPLDDDDARRRALRAWRDAEAAAADAAARAPDAEARR
jgi:hypothetical protein